MISPAVEARMSDARRALNAQSREYPLLIHIEDGRLVPNVPRLGGQKADKSLNKPFIASHPKYRVYMGPPKAKLEERMRILATQNMTGNAAVVDTTLPTTPAHEFDIGKAGRSELVIFAFENYGVQIDNDKGNEHVMTLRAKVRDLARAAGHMSKETADLAG